MATDEMIAETNSKYSDLFEIDSTFQDGSYDVVVSLPKSIEGAEVESASILKGSIEDIAFFSILEILEVDGVSKVYFVSKPSPDSDYSLSFVYGKGCGFSVTIPIELE